MLLANNLGRSGYLLLQLLENDKQNRYYQQSDKSTNEHPTRSANANRLIGVGINPACKCQRHQAGDKGKGGH